MIDSYRYVSPDGSRFQYTSVLLFIQCLINLVIAMIGMILEFWLIDRRKGCRRREEKV